MEDSTDYCIEQLAGKGKIDDLKKIFEVRHTQLELDIAFENAIAHSQILTAEYLLTLGADFSNYNYQGVYYAAHNNEIEGLKFAISKGVDINVENGMILNVGVISALNSKNNEIIEWLLKNGAKTSLLSSQTLKILNTFGGEELKKLLQNS